MWKPLCGVFNRPEIDFTWLCTSPWWVGQPYRSECRSLLRILSRHWLSSHQGLLVCYLSPSTTKRLLKYGCAHHHGNHTEVSALVVPCWESLLDRRRHWLSSQQGLLDWLDTCYLSPSTTQHLLKYLRICLSWSWEHKTVTFLNTYMSQ